MLYYMETPSKPAVARDQGPRKGFQSSVTDFLQQPSEQRRYIMITKRFPFWDPQPVALTLP